MKCEHCYAGVSGIFSFHIYSSVLNIDIFILFFDSWCYSNYLICCNKESRQSSICLSSDISFLLCGVSLTYSFYRHFSINEMNWKDKYILFKLCKAILFCDDMYYNDFLLKLKLKFSNYKWSRLIASLNWRMWVVVYLSKIRWPVI